MNLFLFTSNSFTYVILIIVLIIPSCIFSFDERYALCSISFDCANKKNLSYPFWIPGRVDCGHPDFELNCSGDSPEINFSSVNFRILDVRFALQTLRLVRTDYVDNLCPPNPVNTTFNQSFFSLPPSTELLTLYYNCSGFSPRISPTGYFGDFRCDNYEESSYYVTRNLSSPLLASTGATLDGLKGFCRRNITIPADEYALTTLENDLSPENLEKALDLGFVLQWDADDGKCADCKRSKGACGYSRESKEFVCFCQDKRHKLTCAAASINRVRKIIIGATGSAGVLIILILLFNFKEITFLFRKRETINNLRNYQNLEALIPLKRYSYREIVKITRSFRDVVGRGGFGTVYRGKLQDGRDVAVKILKDSDGNGEEFINEVASISKTSHVNIVSLLGFCYEESKRAIVYEFVENGSLDRFISNKSLLGMDWRRLHEIAVGVARGLEYLHYGCKTRIVHFDIKPQNILLDDNLCPKVSDFGLAKLCEKKESIMSLLDARGTIGYIAPEVFSRNYGRVSHKSDVYSYGMLVLEMIGARNNERIKNSASESSSMYFPDWIYKDLERGRNMMLLGDEVAKEEEEETAKKMIIVGLWCIQSCPSDRPPMNKVVEMLEGSLNALEVPPKPSLRGSILPFRESPRPSMEENSSSSEV